MIIIGAGLSGLIAASMLRDQVDCIYEQQSNLPNNHHALLRFRSSVVGDATGIAFRKVRVMKAVSTKLNPVAAALQYSLKCTGKAQLRSVVTANGEIEDRFIAPPDFIQRLAGQLQTGKIAYDLTLEDAMESRVLVSDFPIISTIPMPVLMQQLGYECDEQFTAVEGYTIKCDLPETVDVNATVYIPSIHEAPYRASITGNHLMVEVANPDGKEIHEDALLDAGLEGLQSLGLVYDFGKFFMENAEIKHSRYAKINPINESVRKRFILWASEHHNIYSLGRFATWRPSLLLDDVVNDVRVIQKIVGGDMTHNYEAMK